MLTETIHKLVTKKMDGLHWEIVDSRDVAEEANVPRYRPSGPPRKPADVCHELVRGLQSQVSVVAAQKLRLNC